MVSAEQRRSIRRGVMLIKPVATLALLLWVGSSSALTLAEVVSKYRQSVIFVKVAKADGATGAVTEQHGTGFILNKEGYVLTAAHVVSGGPGLQVDVRGAVGSREAPLEPMEVLHESSNFDVALIRFKDTSKRRSPVILGDPWAQKDGDTIYIMGFPGTEEWFHSSGVLSGKGGPKGSWNTTAVLNPGMSGGPAFNTKGAVVAMTWGGVPTAGVSGVNRVLPVNLLRDALIYADLRRSMSTTASTSQLPYTPVNIQEIPYAIAETLTSLGGPQVATQTYTRIFNAKPGFKIVDYTLVSRSENNADSPAVLLSPDGKQLSVRFSLSSGPASDQWRGWIDAEVQTRQAPE